MEFRVLGSLEVTDGGRTIELGGAKQRALLAILLLHANEVVSTDRLIDALWEEEAAEGARKTLQVYVSGLRKALGKERLETRAPGYRLRVEPDELDIARFQRLAEEGRSREALALWRGPCLQEFAYERFAAGEIERIEELRLGCVEDRIESDLAAGRNAALVGELEALVRKHPLRERLRAQLMLALYRSRRQAEALEAYQGARRALVEELGIEPGRPLRELQQAILRQDAGLDVEIRVDQAPELPSEPEPPAPSEPTPRSERKTVTVVHVLFAVASADGEQIDPEVLRRLFRHAFEHATAVVEAHQGAVETIAGDAVSAVFGLPHVHEDDATRAVRAAEEIQRRLLSDRPGSPTAAGVEVRIGVSTGAVVTGGDAAGVQLRATGEPFTASGRLARDCAPGEIGLDEATRQAVQTSRREDRRFASPMVGRERERRRLHDAFEQAAGDRSCQLFTVLGAAGVGKSRLVQEFLGDIAGQALIARGRCLPYGEGITFWPVLEAIKDVAELDDTDSPADARSRLAALIEDEEGADLVAQRVTEVIGLAEAAAGLDESFQAVRAFLEALAVDQPLIVVFDDVHWGEETFLDFVEHLADWSRGAPVLLLCMARPELLDARPSWSGGKLNATTILLEPLSDDECGELVANLVGEAKLAEEVEGRIVRAAEGNPLFVEEMLSMLIDDGLLVQEDGRWAAAGDLTSFPVPPTIQALLAARLDQLSSHERAVVEPAAVEGMVFHEGSVTDLASRGTDVAGALASLVRKELVRPERGAFAAEQAFRFRHLMIRDAAYDAIPKEARAALHERHVTWLEERTGDHSVEFEEIVGYHLEQAYRYRSELGAVDEAGRALGRRAAELLGSAGRRAFARSDAPAGVNLVSRAVGLLSPDDPLRVELVPNVRVVQGMSDLSWADRVLTEAIEASSTTGNRGLAARALVHRGFLRLFTDPDVTPQELFEVAQRAISVFEDLGDELGQARAWRLVGQAHYLNRRPGLCAEASERALEHVRRTDDRFEEREIVEWLVIALLLGPAPAPEAITRCEQLLEEIGDGASLVRAGVIAGLATLIAMQGRTDEALALMAQSWAIMDEASEWIWVAQFWWGYLYVWLGQAEKAERQLRPAYEALKPIGEKSHFSSIAHELSAVTYAQGRYDEAERLTYECEDACHANDVHSGILWRSIRAKVLARRQEFEGAQQLAREALDLAETSDFLLGHAEALLDFAEVLELAGEHGASAQALEDAIALYERKGNLLAARGARARLANATGRA